MTLYSYDDAAGGWTFGLPAVVTLPDGRRHHSPGRLDDATLAAGDPTTLPVVDDPVDPPAGQELAGHTLTREGDTVRRSWTYTPIPQDRLDRAARETDLAGSIATLRQWADDARGTTVTQINAVTVLGTVVNRLGTFFDRFADLLEQRQQ